MDFQSNKVKYRIIDGMIPRQNKMVEGEDRLFLLGIVMRIGANRIGNDENRTATCFEW